MPTPTRETATKEWVEDCRPSEPRNERVTDYHISANEVNILCDLAILSLSAMEGEPLVALTLQKERDALLRLVKASKPWTKYALDCSEEWHEFQKAKDAVTALIGQEV